MFSTQLFICMFMQEGSEADACYFTSNSSYHQSEPYFSSFISKIGCPDSLPLFYLMFNSLQLISMENRLYIG